VSFLVAWRLWLLVSVIALAWAWVAAARRKRRDALRFTNVGLLDVVAPRKPHWRRHVPPVLFLLGLTALIIGFARPVRAVKVADERSTIVLAVDTSLSMEAEDVSPSRLAAAQDAARTFVDELPEGINLGLVSFNGVASLSVPPSEDHTAVRTGIDDLELGEGTAIGEAIYASLDAIESAPAGVDGEPAPARIVLMSDGETTMGRPNEEAAAAAADAGVPVYTIAFGTAGGTITAAEGIVQPVPVQPEPLQDIASATEGESFEAASLPQLTEVYSDIGSVVGYRDEDRDVSGWPVGFGLVLLAAAGAASLMWNQRLP
jgi:Ca-activated chloride channel family protein